MKLGAARDLFLLFGFSLWSPTARPKGQASKGSPSPFPSRNAGTDCLMPGQLSYSLGTLLPSPVLPPKELEVETVFLREQYLKKKKKKKRNH